MQLAKISYVPYSVGLLQAYAQQYGPPGAFEFLMPLFAREDMDQMAASLVSADVVGISLYVWNERITLGVAERLKKINPDVIIVAGGPSVPNHPAEFLAKNRCIDVAVHGEGEDVFLQILNRARVREWDEVPSVSYWKDGAVRTNMRSPRRRELGDIPSPYLAGVFEPLLEANRDWRFQYMWETNRGCPFSCTFCDWGSATASKVYQFPMDRLTAEIEWFASHKASFVFCCDANFGILPRDVDIADAVLEVHKRTGFPSSFGANNTKNATERAYQIQKKIAWMSAAGVTLSMQSTSPTTLAAAERSNISLDFFRELQRRFQRDGTPTYTDMIIGLPAETYDSFANGVSDVIAGGQNNRIQFYNCHILPNAPMAAPDYIAKYGLKTRAVPMQDPYEPLSPPGSHVPESLDLVVETAAMSGEDWERVKTFAWFTEFAYFDRVLHLPLTLLVASGMKIRTAIEALIGADAELAPTIAGAVRSLQTHAAAVRRGAGEYIAEDVILGIRWPADEWLLTRLATTFALDRFYEEAVVVLSAAAEQAGGETLAAAVAEATRFNARALRMPFEVDNDVVTTGFNVWEACERWQLGGELQLEAGEWTYEIVRREPLMLSWDQWGETLITGHNDKRDAYFRVKPLTAMSAAG